MKNRIKFSTRRGRKAGLRARAVEGRCAVKVAAVPGGNGARAFFKANFSGLSSRAQLVRARAAYTSRVRELKLKYRPKVPCEWPPSDPNAFHLSRFWKEKAAPPLLAACRAAPR